MSDEPKFGRNYPPPKRKYMDFFKVEPPTLSPEAEIWLGVLESWLVNQSTPNLVLAIEQADAAVEAAKERGYIP